MGRDSQQWGIDRSWSDWVLLFLNRGPFSGLIRLAEFKHIADARLCDLA